MNLSTLVTKPVDSSPVIGPERWGLSDPQRYALLQVRGGEAPRAILAHLDEVGWEQPTRYDRSVLRDKRLIRWRTNGSALHDITPLGQFAATEIIRELSKSFGVHCLTRVPGGPGRAPRGECSCGWSHTVPRNDSADTRIGVAFGLHMTDPDGSKARARSAAMWAEIERRMAEAVHG